MAIAALFDIDDDGEDYGFEAANNQTLSLKLRDTAGASTVLFQVWSDAGEDPSLGIAANPPRASKGAPELTLVGATSGQAVSPSTVGGTVTVALPASGSHSWLIRCVVNGGQRSLPNGVVVADPSLIYERGVFIPTANATRKIIITERSQFDAHGWPAAFNDAMDAGASLGAFTPPGTGAVTRSVVSRLTDTVYVTDYMTTAEKAAAIAGDWSVDHQPAIQRAIDYALYQGSTGFSSGRRVWLGGGMYRIDRPIHIGYGTDFRSIIFEGEGKREGGTFDGGGCGTVIRPFFSDAPAICIQGGRSTVVRGVSLIGQNYDHVVALMQGAASMTHVDAATWVDPSLASNAASRYAPYAAIAIDPYTGAQPTPHYPDVEYPAFLGAVAQYDKGQSRDVLIEDCRIVGFVVGVVQHPGDADGNGDFTRLSRCAFAFCTYGFSWGNSQARVNELSHCTFAYLHTCLASTVHGLQIGNPQVTLTACAFETSIRIIDVMNLGYGVGPLFLGCFAEAVYSIGRVNGVSQNAGSLKFLNCEFGFWWNQYGVPTWVLECEGSMQVRFENVAFYLAAANQGFLHFRATGSALTQEPARALAFEGCQTQGFDLGGGLYAKCAYNATLGITVTWGSTSLDRFSVRSGYLTDLDTGSLLGVGVLHSEVAIAPRHLCAPVYAKRLKSLTTGNDPGVDVAWRIFAFAIATVVSTVGRVVTLTITGITTANLMQSGGDVGDVVESLATGAVFRVQSRTGEQIAIEAMSGYDKDGNLLNSIVPGGLLHATNCRRYALSAVLFGDVTSGSPTVTNLTLGNGNAPTLEDILTVDDYLHVDQDVDAVLNPSDGSARLASYDTGARTMTFAGNFAYSQTRRRFAIFVRPAMEE